MTRFKDITALLTVTARLVESEIQTVRNNLEDAQERELEEAAVRLAQRLEGLIEVSGSLERAFVDMLELQQPPAGDTVRVRTPLPSPAEAEFLTEFENAPTKVSTGYSKMGYDLDVREEVTRQERPPRS